LADGLTGPVISALRRVRDRQAVFYGPIKVLKNILFSLFRSRKNRNICDLRVVPDMMSQPPFIMYGSRNLTSRQKTLIDDTIFRMRESFLFEMYAQWDI